MLIFERLVKAIEDNDNQWETLEELIEMRANIGIYHALSGFNMTLEEARELLANADDLTPEQQSKRAIVTAAIDNIIDFSAAEEYQMVSEFPEIEDLELEDEDEDEMDAETLEELMLIFNKYNLQYADVENNDIEYAMITAAYLAGISESTVLTYMTMGDERVRPWHLQYEGYSAPKALFPAWLIPPIEHSCRCYLVEDPLSPLAQIKNENSGASTTLEMPSWFNRTFKESVALGGRIFSDEHPYFQIPERHRGRLKNITDRLKEKYFG